MNRSEFIAMAKDVHEHPEHLADYRKNYRNVYPFSDGIFNIYGSTQAGEPVLIEVQQNFNTLFIDRLIYYTGRVISRTVKKAQDYDLPHIYVLSILTENREQSDRAEMLRIFRDVLEDKEIPEEKLKRLLDKDFANDVSFKGYTDETLLNEVDGMTDLLYERQGGYLEAKEDDAKSMLAEGLAIDMISRVTKLSENRIRKLQAELAHETAHT